jgi:hypothetical protein
MNKRRIVHGFIIFGAVIITPFLPDDLLPRFLCKAVLGGATAALGIEIFDRIWGMRQLRR